MVTNHLLNSHWMIIRNVNRVKTSRLPLLYEPNAHIGYNDGQYRNVWDNIKVVAFVSQSGVSWFWHPLVKLKELRVLE